MAGLPSAGVATVTAEDLCGRLDRGDGPAVLDVRTQHEVAVAGSIEGARHVPLGELGSRLDEVPREGQVCVLCGGGLRSMTAASLLRAAGRDNVSVMLGGLGAWNSTTCPVRLAAADLKEAE
jgi:hydroxyacylglutathione hydrolase